MTNKNTVPLSIPRCPRELKEAIFKYADRKGRSGAAQAIIFLWDRIEDLGIQVEGGGGNRTRSREAA